MNKNLFTNAIVNGIETHFNSDMKSNFVQNICNFICKDPEDTWAEVIDDEGFKVFVNNVHQINVVFDGSRMRFLLTEDTIDIENSSFDSEFKDFGLACLTVVSFYDSFLRHAAEVINENLSKTTSSSSNDVDAWPV